MFILLFSYFLLKILFIMNYIIISLYQVKDREYMTKPEEVRKLGGCFKFSKKVFKKDTSNRCCICSILKPQDLIQGHPVPRSNIFRNKAILFTR